MFPTIADAAAFDAIARDEVVLQPGLDAIAERHGLTDLVRFADGSLPVYAAGQSSVLKVYPPCFFSERDREAAVLGALAGKLSIPTPGLDAVGEIEGWGYVVMQRLHGVSLFSAWSAIGEAQRLRLAADLGEALATLHGLPAPDLGDEPWSDFIAAQTDSAMGRQIGRGLEARWLEQLDGLLDRVDLGVSPATSLLHTEVMREHLLVDEGSDGWRLSGLFDFEPAMVGAPEYELASVGLFVSAGDAPFLRRLLTAYGYADADLGLALQRRCLVYAVLHKYSNLPWYLKRVPPPEDASQVDDLARIWWAM